MSNFEFKCQECDGHQQMICECCNSEADCESCDGEGVDVDKVDIEKFDEACMAAHTAANGCVGGSCALIEDIGPRLRVWVGRCGLDKDHNHIHIQKVYYRDFLKQEEND